MTTMPLWKGCNYGLILGTCVVVCVLLSGPGGGDEDMVMGSSGR